MLRMHGEAVCNIGLYLSYALANLHKYLSLDRQTVYVTDAAHGQTKVYVTDAAHELRHSENSKSQRPKAKTPEASI